MLSGLRVLLAEDNPTNQLVATQMLESLGATCAVAADGVEALDLVHRAPYDLLLIDIEMPRMNGIELMRRLRAEGGPISRLPMVALTAYVMREHLTAIHEAGADGVIAKPILSIEQFGTDILACMAKRAAQAGPAGDEPAQPGAAPGEGAIDMSIYDTLASIIGPAAMTEFLGKVGADLRAAGQRLEQAVAAPDIAEARAATHVLISVAGTIGAVRAQKLARGINNAAHAADTQAVCRDAPALLAEIGDVVAFVEARHEAPGA